SVPVTGGISNHCTNPEFACYARPCVCACRDEPATVPDIPLTCDASLFASAAQYPRAVVTDDEFVYWTSAGLCPIANPDDADGMLIRARREDGSGAVAIHDLPCPTQIAISGNDIFWSNEYALGASTSIGTAHKDGSDVRTFVEGLRAPGTLH